MIAGISACRFCLRLFPGAIKGPQVVEFLQALGQQIRQPLLVIRDGAPIHRCTLVRAFWQQAQLAL